MSEYSKPVPKNPTDSDATLETVLETIIEFTKDGDELVSYQNKPDKVVLTFDGV
jgi:hypothetical protein